ncbi:MAG: ABC transporter ATP-binding protein [Oscillospiraceae bacterium]|jgi:ABC-2 type transport system ATP-binding protein|nr:ABC transporter ATP-binding protein [Oscillospiraceae bacterium]
MIEVKNLSKAYGAKKALESLSFTASDGEILGFLGPNGAGKSTTMNILTGYLSSDQGEVRLNGIDILSDPVRAKKEIGYLPEHPPLYPDMTVDEYLGFIYDLKKVKLPKREHLHGIRALVKVDDVRGRVIRNLSKGYQQRVGFAGALVGDPKILILDEPTVGLDPKQIIEIRALIKKLGQNRTVVLSSHILPEIQAVCDKIVIINKGKLVADGAADTLAAGLSKEHDVVVQIEGEIDHVRKLLSAVAGVKKVTDGKNLAKNVTEYDVETAPGTDVRRGIFAAMSENNCPILMMRTKELTLEEIFLRVTAGERFDTAAAEEADQSQSANNENGGADLDGNTKA